MKKRAYFDSQFIKGWPHPGEIERYSLAPSGQRWFNTGGNDGACFTGEGLEGTEHLTPKTGRIDVRLDMWGNPEHGVLLIWAKYGGKYDLTYSSKGDMNRLREHVRSLHDTPLPVGLFVPFEKAWRGVKEFIETDGQLPRSIEWVANETLPHETFPDP